jgi:hypothetical protein
VSTEAWSTAICWAVAFLVDPLEPVGPEPEPEPEPVEPVELLAVVELAVLPVVAPLPVPLPPAAPDELPEELDEDSSAAVSAFSSWFTCLMSLVTWLCADVAWLSAAEQEALPLPPDEGAVVDVVVEVVVEDVEELAQAAVAWVSAAVVWLWSLSKRVWSEVSAAWRPVMADGEVDEAPEPEGEPVPDAAGLVVAVVVAWTVVVALAVVVVVAVWLASALARVALAEASDAWAEVTVASSVARSSDAKVWPAATDWPTETSTALTVPEALKLRSAWSTGVMVPTESSVDTTVPLPTTAVR